MHKSSLIINHIDNHCIGHLGPMTPMHRRLVLGVAGHLLSLGGAPWDETRRRDVNVRSMVYATWSFCGKPGVLWFLLGIIQRLHD